MKKAAAAEKATESPSENPPCIEITVNPSVHLELTGDETVDKKLRELKKVLIIELIRSKAFEKKFCYVFERMALTHRL